MVTIRQSSPAEFRLTPEDAALRAGESFPPGSRLILEPGCYGLPLRFCGLRGTPDNPLVITAEPGAVLDGNHSQWTALTLEDCRWVAVVGLQVRGVHTSCVLLRGCQACLLLDCALAESRDSGLTVLGWSRPRPTRLEDPWEWYEELPLSTGIWVVNCTVSDCARGVELEWAAECEFAGGDLGEVHLRNAFLNRFHGSCAARLQEGENCLQNQVGACLPPWPETTFWPEPPAVRVRRPRADDAHGRRQFAERVARELPCLTEFRFGCSDPDFADLVRNSLFLLCRNQDEEGRMRVWPEPETYAELDYQDGLPDQQRFVHGRDSMEAAQALTFLGADRVARAAVEYNLSLGVSNHAVVWRPGADRTRLGEQMDVVTHLVRAVDAQWRYCGAADLLECAYAPLAACLQETDRRYYRSELGLCVAPAGEQTAVDATAAFLFENLSWLDALRRFRRLAEHRQEPQVAQWAAERVARLRQGIERRLRDERTYLAGAIVTETSTRPLLPRVTGSTLVPFRYYPDADAQALDLTYQAAAFDRVPWGGYWPVLTRWTDQRGDALSMTKDTAALMGYEARTGRFASLAAHLQWLLAMTVRPSGVLPDHYEYYRHHLTVGTPFIGYVQWPEGDITLGIGNCEQTSEFLLDLLHNLLGLRPERQGLTVQPALPWSFSSWEVDAVPLPLDLGGGRVGYRLERTSTEQSLRLNLPQGCPARVLLPLPAGAELTASTHPLRRRSGAEVDWVESAATGSEQISISWR